MYVRIVTVQSGTIVVLRSFSNKKLILAKSLFHNTNTNTMSIEYHNNGKTNPDAIVLYMYTTYDSNFFRFAYVISCPMILRQLRGFVDS